MKLDSLYCYFDTLILQKQLYLATHDQPDVFNRQHSTAVFSVGLQSSENVLYRPGWKAAESSSHASVMVNITRTSPNLG